MEGKYIASLKVLKRNPMEWDDIKKHLSRQIGDNLFPEMIGSGYHHVCKFDMVKNEHLDWREADYMDEYAIIARLSVAKEQRIILPVMQELSVEYDNKKYTRVCLYCGNALMLDSRGSCNACGSPNGGYK